MIKIWWYKWFWDKHLKEQQKNYILQELTLHLVELQLYVYWL